MEDSGSVYEEEFEAKVRLVELRKQIEERKKAEVRMTE